MANLFKGGNGQSVVNWNTGVSTDTGTGIYSNGKLVGVDTGTQSRIPTPIERIINQPLAPPTNLFSGGGRGSSGGGSSGGGSSNVQAGPTRADLEAEQRRQAELQRKQAEAKKLQEQLKKEREQKIYSGTIGGQVSGQQVVVGVGGGVTVGTGDSAIKYHGGAYIPEVGMTATQYRNKLKREAVASGELNVKDWGRVSFSGMIRNTTQPSAKINISENDLFSSGFSLSGIPKYTNNNQEYYSSNIGMFGTSTYGGQGTSIFRSPTEEEQIKIDKAQGFSIFPQKKTAEQEYFEFKKEPTIHGQGTSITRSKKESELSEDALVYGRYLNYNLGSQIKFQTEMDKEKQNILGIISSDGITQEEADWGNTRLQEIYSTKLGEYDKEGKIKYQDIITGAFKERRPFEFKTREIVMGGTADWGITKWAEDYDPLGFETKAESKVGSYWTTFGVPKVLAGGGAFVSGMWKGVREQPLTIAKTAGVAIGVSAITAGLGSHFATAYGAVKVASVSKKIGTASKILYAGYGVSIGARVFGAGDFYSGAETLGRITSTELAPFVVGARVGRRVGGYIPSFKSSIPKEFKQEVKAYEKAFKIMKKSTVEMQDIRWGRVKEVPTKAGKIIENFMKKHNLILGGTTAIETGGINLRRLPRDVEAYGSFNKISKMKLYRDLGKQLKSEGITDFKISNKGIIFGGEGHGFNLQDINTLNLGRYRYKIYTTPSGVRVADPLSTAYNKVADLLKSAPLGTPKAKKIILKLSKPELITKATAGSRIYERYPKDVIGALSTARDITQKSLIRYGDFLKQQIPLLQEYRMLRFGQAKELIKPYLGKLKFEEAPAVPYYYTGKSAGIFSGAKYVKSYTLSMIQSPQINTRVAIIDKRGMANMISTGDKVRSSSYYWLPKTPPVKYPVPYAPILFTPIKYNFQPTSSYKGFTPVKTSIYNTTSTKYFSPNIYSPTKPSSYYPITYPTYPSIPTFSMPQIISLTTIPPEKKRGAGKLIPRLPFYKEKSKRTPQLFKQPTRYQVSLTGAFIGAKLRVPKELAGGLGVRGYI